MYCVPYFFIEIHFLLESDRKASEQVIKWPLLIGIEVQYHKCSQVRDCRRILRGRGDGGPKFSNLCICSWARRFFSMHMTLKNPEGGKEGPGPPISQPLPSSWIRYCKSRGRALSVTLCGTCIYATFSVLAPTASNRMEMGQLFFYSDNTLIPVWKVR